MGRILIVEDERAIREGLVRALRGAGHDVFEASRISTARALARQESVDCVLLDLRLEDGGDGLSLLEELRDVLAPGVPVVIATAYSDSEHTIRAMREGAFEYVTKPFDLSRLLDVVARAVLSHTEAAAMQPVEPRRSLALVGTSETMLPVWKTIGRAAASSVPVLITGETGTGKELVARAIHEHGPRSRKPFVAVNLSALPMTLLESELFGHERGAFTSAVTLHRGRVELAQGGTLFLDEIGDLEPALQTKLLRFLQEQTFERVGGTTSFSSDARIIAATNRPVRPGDPESRLREDLYYRIAVIDIEVPPLRARRSDIALLAQTFLALTPAKAFTSEALAMLTRWNWPGNVRELAHAVERAAVMCGSELIDVGALPPGMRIQHSAPDAPAADPYEGLPLRDAVAVLERRLILPCARGIGRESRARSTDSRHRPSAVVRETARPRDRQPRRRRGPSRSVTRVRIHDALRLLYIALSPAWSGIGPAGSLGTLERRLSKGNLE